MHNKIKAILITLLIVLLGVGIVDTAMNYPDGTKYTALVVMIGAGLYWLYQLILSIIENK